MDAEKSGQGKKYYTVAEANAALPLVRVIVQDIAELARDLQDRYERLMHLQGKERGAMGQAYVEELQQVPAEFERDQDRMREYIGELQKLGIELKDHQAGLVDFPGWLGNREVYLCWRLGEPEVAHWHELDAGFAGRQKLLETSGPKARTESRLTSDS